MLGFMLNDQEVREMEYLLKREMEEILLDLEDPRISLTIKRSMEIKYKLVFRLFCRVAPLEERKKYMITNNKYKKILKKY